MLHINNKTKVNSNLKEQRTMKEVGIGSMACIHYPALEKDKVKELLKVMLSITEVTGKKLALTWLCLNDYEKQIINNLNKLKQWSMQ